MITRYFPKEEPAPQLASAVPAPRFSIEEVVFHLCSDAIYERVFAAIVRHCEDGSPLQPATWQALQTYGMTLKGRNALRVDVRKLFLQASTGRN